uniref:RING-type domain-containing protein n=1 Tax=Caenorhabditis japonica TaxID=281687 RepID=A0A8R1I1I7_CAEJA
MSLSQSQPQPLSSKCPSRQSHSDYCSLASSCSSSDEEINFDEENVPSQAKEPTFLPVGVCPHCQQVFEQPVSLQCGHSVCLICCNQLLFSRTQPLIASSSSSCNSRPRMGISRRAPSSLAGSTATVMYRTPKCPVCNSPPSTAGPVPNLALDHLLRNMRTFRWHQIEHDVNNRGSRKWDDESPIQECKVAVLGARGVGKTCLTRVQYSNDVMFSDVHSENEDGDAYMLDIADGMSVEKACVASRGIIIMYSVVDRQSFYHAAEIYKKLEQNREHNQPIVLVGSKKDRKRQREVTSFEGQQLARNFECPFLEVSSKNNDCVYETFAELVSLIQKQHNAFKNVVKQSLV